MGTEPCECLQTNAGDHDAQHTGGLEQEELAASQASRSTVPTQCVAAQSSHSLLGANGFSGPCLRTEPTWEWKNF